MLETAGSLPLSHQGSSWLEEKLLAHPADAYCTPCNQTKCWTAELRPLLLVQDLLSPDLQIEDETRVWRAMPTSLP